MSNDLNGWTFMWLTFALITIIAAGVNVQAGNYGWATYDAGMVLFDLAWAILVNLRKGSL